MSVYIVDTECTDLKEPEVIELAWIRPHAVEDIAGASDRIPTPLVPMREAPGDSRSFVQRYQPKKPSSFGALNVHHILPAELEGCAPAAEAKLPGDCAYIVAHNADHDWKCLGAPAHVKRICTDAMARWAWPEADSYALGALLYMLLGPTQQTRERLRNAHSALADVENCAILLERILATRPEITTWSQLYAYSEQCRIPRVMPIGEKQGLKGLTLDEAVEADPGFCDWCLRQDWLDPYLAEGLRQAIKRMHAKWGAA